MQNRLALNLWGSICLSSARTRCVHRCAVKAVANAWNPATWEVEAGGLLLSFRKAMSAD